MGWSRCRSYDGEKAGFSINPSILCGWMFLYVHFVYENVSSALPLGPVDVLWESAQHNCHKQHNYVCLYVQYIHTSIQYVRKVNTSSVVDPADMGKNFRIRISLLSFGSNRIRIQNSKLLEIFKKPMVSKYSHCAIKLFILLGLVFFNGDEYSDPDADVVVNIWIHEKTIRITKASNYSV